MRFFLAFIRDSRPRRLPWALGFFILRISKNRPLCDGSGAHQPGNKKVRWAPCPFHVLLGVDPREKQITI